MIRAEEEARHWLEKETGCTVEAWDRLNQFVDLLRAESARQNLVSLASLSTVWVRHIADSAQLALRAPASAESWLDVGSGAGFPGLVAGIMRPETAISLVEPRTRRCEWLRQAIEILRLNNVTVCELRIELLPTRSFSIISARAVAAIAKLVELAARFSTAETLWLLPKGKTALQELATLAEWDHSFHVEHSITDEAAGVIVGHLYRRQRRLA